ncbi:hypothetical protein QNH39_13245 [Neobacillus novalis]|uniref:Uncharacterized protein n=1 Tax=Neobacillus novalis TaxID=220687 RepID=A0AA95MVB8_9BACI|nr:hypothetical protein [Neobacillus novalis]WHY88735.1 hypothetical protein QNH39_13245 [Neobacillus novalis]
MECKHIPICISALFAEILHYLTNVFLKKNHLLELSEANGSSTFEKDYLGVIGFTIIAGE